MGNREVKEILIEGQKQGYSESTLRRVKKKLGIKSIPIRDKKGKIQKWEWVLPEK